jgi:hypothetical protein
VASVVAFIPDLMDRSKVQAVGGDAVRFVSSPPGLVDAVSDPGVRLVVLDLSRPGVLDVLPALAAAEVRTIGFGSHMDRALLDGARQAGCDEVLARSAFFGRLREILDPD